MKDAEAEYENLARVETSNAQMSEIQIASLEEKYMAMFKKYKSEQKLKNQWMQSYQMEYNNRLKEEVELRKAEGSYKGQLSRNNELNSKNEELTLKIR